MLKMIKDIWKIEYLFIVMMFGVFLGSKFLAIPTPFLTLNLGMILPIFMLYASIKRLGWINRIFLYTGPLFLLTIYASIQTFALEEKALAVQDVRSLMMMSLTALTLLYSYEYFGKRIFFILMSKVFWSLFVLLTVFGLFEYFTGIHIWATGIETILSYTISDFTFAPRFIWGNPNNFITALLVVCAGIILFDTRVAMNIFKQFLLLSILFFFSDTAQSKFGKIAALFMVAYIIYLNRALLIGKYKSNKKSLLIGFIFLLGVVINASWFLGPKFSSNRDYYLNEILVQNKTTGNLSYVNTDSLSIREKDSLIKRLKFARDKKRLGSTELRKNLIKNGAYYYGQEPVFGIGPGQYQLKNIKHQNKYEIETLQGSHHFFVDIFSQYGILGILFILFYIITVLVYLVGSKNWDQKMAALISVSFLFFGSNLPSKFSTFECAYIALAFITFLSYNAKTVGDENRI